MLYVHLLFITVVIECRTQFAGVSLMLNIDEQHYYQESDSTIHHVYIQLKSAVSATKKLHTFAINIRIEVDFLFQ